MKKARGTGGEKLHGVAPAPVAVHFGHPVQRLRQASDAITAWVRLRDERVRGFAPNANFDS